MKTTFTRVQSMVQHAPALVVLLALGVMFFFTSCSKDPCKDKVCPDCPKNHLVLTYRDTSTNACDSAFHVGTRIDAYKISNLADTGQWLYSYGLADSCKALLLPNPMTRYIVINAFHNIRDTFTILKVNRISSGQASDADNCCFCFPVEQVAINSSREKNLKEENVDMEKVILVKW
jgi:hypothetical protein